MNKDLKKDINIYLLEIKKGLKCGINIKKAFLSEFKNELENYVDENPEVTIETIINEFGNPSQIITNFKSYDFIHLKKKMRINLLIEVFFIVLSLLIIIALIYIINTLGGPIYVS